MNNIRRFSKLDSPCFSAAHIVEMHGALNKYAYEKKIDPRGLEVPISLHELNILVAALEAK